jgi:tRNA pseudouridine55 synthase
MQETDEGEILLFDKPYRWTSFDLVNKVRFLYVHKTGHKKLKVGHAGTLDPLATGLLLICIGRATKRIVELQDLEKEYLATVRFGATTPCFDLEKPIDREYPYRHITREIIQEALQSFTGWIEQVPPVFSAKMIRGERAYEKARRGETMEMKPSRVFIRELELLRYDAPDAYLKISCSKGTYIRSFARDIGAALGSGAHLTELRRTKIGMYNVDNAKDIISFENSFQQA